MAFRTIAAFIGLSIFAANGVAQSTRMSPACAIPPADVEPSPSLGTIGRKLNNGEPVRIMAIGSSSTYGVGATSRAKTYPSDLRGILVEALTNAKVEIINRGISGEVAATTAERIRNEVAVEQPDLVLWQLGTNDALSRVPPEEFEKTVVDTLDWLRENHVDVALIGLQYTAPLAKDENYLAIRMVLQRITKKYNILYVHRYAAMQFIAKTRKNVKMMASDNFHLNDLGYECMAEHVARAVVTSIFVKRFRPIVPK